MMQLSFLMIYGRSSRFARQSKGRSKLESRNIFPTTINPIDCIKYSYLFNQITNMTTVNLTDNIFNKHFEVFRFKSSNDSTI